MCAHLRNLRIIALPFARKFIEDEDEDEDDFVPLIEDEDDERFFEDEDEDEDEF